MGLQRSVNETDEKTYIKSHTHSDTINIAHAHTHTHARTRAHAHTHTHTHTQVDWFQKRLMSSTVIEDAFRSAQLEEHQKCTSTQVSERKRDGTERHDGNEQLYLFFPILHASSEESSPHTTQRSNVCRTQRSQSNIKQPLHNSREEGTNAFSVFYFRWCVCVHVTKACVWDSHVRAKATICVSSYHIQ